MEQYGSHKQLATENYYLSLTKTLNSALCTRETLKTARRLTTKEIQYAHMGQLVIRDGICYASFIQNPGTDGEQHDSVTSGVVLAVFSLERAKQEDFDPEKDVTLYPIGGKGDYCAGYKACSIFKDNSMCLVGEKLYICFSFITEDGTSHIFRKIFHIDRMEWGEEVKVMLRYKGEELDFSDENLNRIYLDKGLEPRAKGLIELVSAWNEYKGEYYATGVTIEQANNGFIVKTNDFRVMDLVDTVPFNDQGTAEIASCIYHGRLYVACRQDYGVPYLYMGLYDLETGKWLHHYKLPDGNVRPWFFVWKDELYLLNTVDELHRRYTNISRVRVPDKEIYVFFNDRCPVEILATLKDCGSYFATAEYEGEIYFVSTKDTESFGKLALCFQDPDKVNEKLMDLLL